MWPRQSHITNHFRSTTTHDSTRKRFRDRLFAQKVSTSLGMATCLTHLLMAFLPQQHHKNRCRPSKQTRYHTRLVDLALLPNRIVLVRQRETKHERDDSSLRRLRVDKPTTTLRGCCCHHASHLPSSLATTILGIGSRSGQV